MSEQKRKIDSSLTMTDLETISMMVTDTKLLAMKLMVAHNLGSKTKAEDCNFSIRLQAFSKTLQEIGKYYETN
jgi:hypothetical protein